MGAGRFTLNISRVNGSVAIDTGIVQASATQTVFDRNPKRILATDLIHSIEQRFLAAQAESDWDDCFDTGLICVSGASGDSIDIALNLGEPCKSRVAITNAWVMAKWKIRPMYVAVNQSLQLLPLKSSQIIQSTLYIRYWICKTSSGQSPGWGREVSKGMGTNLQNQSKGISKSLSMPRN
ncbi:hypothetical protein CsSME_00007529 [Camellia sinensis var. sinensis]